MKIKYLILCLVLIITFPIYSQNFTGIRICINPGHGGNDANDRFIAATGYWESEGNLVKGLALRDLLVPLGATIIMTRTLNRTEDDLPLSQIVSIANANNVDFMHSIHSNAFNGIANYTLLLFRGHDNTPEQPRAKEMGAIMASEMFITNRTTGQHNRGDFTFYGNTTGLGVLRGLTMPGTLSEGSFHDYIPESFRLRNTVYLENEAWAMFRSFVRYFNLTPSTLGIVAGVLRDPSKLVTYYSTPSTNDRFLPLNNIQVTLNPGNRVYNGDTFTNGFFMFDSVTPGNYRLIYQRDAYLSDSVNVTVTANQITFADRFLLFDTTAAPTIIDFSPVHRPDSVKTVARIILRFSLPMRRAETQAAFSTSPPSQGTFVWSGEDQILTYTPFPPYERATQYTVTLSSQAKSIWNVSPAQNFSFSFITKNRNRILLERSFPLANARDISTTVQFKLTFDAPVFQGSLAGNVNLFDASGTRISVKNVRNVVEAGKGVIYFEPFTSLLNNSNYRLALGGRISDIDSIPMVDSVSIPFTTERNDYVSGNILDNFEDVRNWTQPNQNATTTGVDTNITKFDIALDRYFSGSASGRITYQFTQANNGVVRVFNSAGINTGSNDASLIGIRVFGDLSNNLLELWYTHSGNQNAILFLDTLNWTGWKLKRFSLNQIPGSGNRILNSIVIRQNPNGTRSGLINLDDYQNNISVSIKDENVTEISSFYLSQNYPNPFNPTTVINYQIPVASFVTLKIYDVLGNEVATLVNEHQTIGKYAATFSANKLASGVYIYRLQAGEFSLSRKLLLMK